MAKRISLALLVLSLWLPLAARATEGWMTSADGIRLRYLDAGSGQVTLVFLHGWLGRADFWDAQLGEFAKAYRVVAIDLAGHGKSGGGRAAWTQAAFGADVKAVVEALDLKQVVLVGHSMSGAVMLEAYRQLPGRVVALVPVDTLADVEFVFPEPQKQDLLAQLRADFKHAVRDMLTARLFLPTSPRAVIDRVVDEAQAAEPKMAVEAIAGYYDYDVRPVFSKLTVPVRAIQAEIYPTNAATNRKYHADYDFVTISGTGHWPMMEKPLEFNADLHAVIDRLGL